MKVQTVHSIERTIKPGVRATRDTPAERPKTVTIPANALVDLPAEEVEELRAMKAVKDPDGKHTSEFEGQNSDRVGGGVAPGTTVKNASNPAATGEERDMSGAQNTADDGKDPKGDGKQTQQAGKGGKKAGDGSELV